ncbi:MAG: hypothetical protein Q4G13_03860 [Moraxella sp.]|nr:hypothetical protein [Moraxella sp.]
MKLQVDMAMCLATTYGYNIQNEDARHLTFMIVTTGTLEQLSVTKGVGFVSKSAEKMTEIYLKDTTLKAVKAAFKTIGINFTKTSFKKAIPFGVGVVIGSTTNYALTKYVGKKTLDWFIINPKEMN